MIRLLTASLIFKILLGSIAILIFTGPFASQMVSGQESATISELSVESTVDEAAFPLTADELSYVINNAVIFFCAVLVLFMQAGFSMVEVGLNSSRNVVNILLKNLMDLSIGAILFFVVGFAIMYTGYYISGDLNPFFAFGGFGIDAASEGASLAPHADWFFQAAFAATAVIIVSGAVAGRMRFGSYLIFSAVLTAFVYPISGYWKWGGGWLGEMGFQDFAGSVVVLAFGGLAGAIMLGPSIGRFSKDGKSLPLPGHHLTFAALGVFILWVGWYGFNPGSQLALGTAGDIDATVSIAVMTTLAAAGAIFATLIGWIWLTKPDLSISLNGALGGLVGITAGCDCFSAWWSMVIGACAGALVVAGVRLLDRLHIDDPVGAWSVHGLCGIWGCLSIGFIPISQLASRATSMWVQFVSTLAIVAWASITMLVLFGLLKVFGILRVSESDELAGLDVSELGMNAYPNKYSGMVGMPARVVANVSTAKNGTSITTVLAGADGSSGQRTRNFRIASA